MPFVTCPKCGAESMAPRELVGLRWRCPQCGADMLVEDEEPRALARRVRHKRNWTSIFIAAGVVGVAVVVFAIISSCGRTGRPLDVVMGERTIGDMVQHFRRHGFEGSYRPGIGNAYGDKEGGIYEGDGFDVTIMRFESQAQAESLEKSGVRNWKVHRNGTFILFVRKGEEERIVSVFQAF